MTHAAGSSTRAGSDVFTTMKLLVSLVFGAWVLALSSVASAQTFSGDARTIGMGGSGKNANIAAAMVAPATPYASIPLPIGLIQTLGNTSGFNPTSDEFDPAWAIETASNPMHYTFGRKSPSSDDPQSRFIRDVVNGEISRDLATYSSFHLPSTLSAEGLASPAFGGTIKFAKQSNGAFQGIFLGAGPYFSFATDATFDDRLVDILENGAHYANTSLTIGDTSDVQLAMSIVVGYRARIALAGWSGDRDGLYLAGNYRYLHGFKYLQPDLTVRFDTDSQGLVTLTPATTPIVIDNLEGDSGTGRAIDVGVQIVRDRWEGGVGVNGIGNKIDWDELTLKRFTLNSLVAGGDFVEQTIANPPGPVTVELPVVTSGNVGYDGDGYAFRALVVHGFNGNSFHGGAEKSLGPFAVRGGARFSRDHWDPTFGFGVGGRIALDVGFYGTHSNLQEKQEISMAMSIRIGLQR
jgi:hypothetical protein